MSSLKQILLLRGLGTGKKKIAQQTGISKTTINEYFDQIQRKGYVLQDLIQMDEPALEALFYNAKDNDEITRYNTLKELFPYFSDELHRTGVNRMVLWEEYKASHPWGYGYSQFCYHLFQSHRSVKGAGFTLKRFKVMIQGKYPLVSSIAAIMTADQAMGIIHL